MLTRKNMPETLSGPQLMEEAKEAYQRGDYLAAARAYQAAAQSYSDQGDAPTSAELRNNSSVAYLRAGDAHSALDMVEGTPAIFATTGDARRQGMALGNLGAALEATNQLEEAAETYQHSAELLGLVHENELRAQVMQSLSLLQVRTGHQMEAVATMQSGLSGLEKPSTKQSFISKLLKFPSKIVKP
jgi:tetratricopeptide (TPR) repeat protein